MSRRPAWRKRKGFARRRDYRKGWVYRVSRDQDKAAMPQRCHTQRQPPHDRIRVIDAPLRWHTPGQTAEPIREICPHQTLLPFLGATSGQRPTAPTCVISCYVVSPRNGPKTRDLAGFSQLMLRSVMAGNRTPAVYAKAASQAALVWRLSQSYQDCIPSPVRAERRRTDISGLTSPALA